MTAASAAVSGSAASAGRIPTPADLDPSPGPVDVRTALALLGLPGALELGDDDARAAGARALDAARGADLTTAEAAAILRTSRQALEALCETGVLTAYRAPGSGPLAHHPRLPDGVPHPPDPRSCRPPGHDPCPTPPAASAGPAGPGRPHRRERSGPRAGRRHRGLTPQCQANRSEQEP